MACLSTGPQRRDPSGRWANDFYNGKAKQTHRSPCAPLFGLVLHVAFLSIYWNVDATPSEVKTKAKTVSFMGYNSHVVS